MTRPHAHVLALLLAPFAKTLAVLAALGAGLTMSSTADAAYNGLMVTSVNTTVALDPTNPTALTPVTIHRVWARFTNANDALFVWGGGGDLGNGVLNNLNSAGTGSGSGFLNNTSGSDLPPTSNAAISASDSYFTIGVTLINQIPAGQGISLITLPGTPPGVTGTSINLGTRGGGIATPPTTNTGAPNPITLAGFTGDGDTQLRVLLVQLVVGSGQNVSGMVGVTINPASLAGSTTTLQNQSFCSMTPAAPTGLVASDGTSPCSHVQVAWNNVSGATGYEIYRDGGFLASDPNGLSPYNDTSAVPGQTYSYQVAAKNVCGPGNLSNSDSGYRAAPVSIVTQPNSQAVCAGGMVTFSVNATGTLLNYQWRHDGSDIPGANLSFYTIQTVSPQHAGSYDCLVSNACGAQTSTSATLTVNICQAYRCVDDSAPAGGNGLDWPTAYNNLQTALTAAANSSGQITTLRIAQGTYRPAAPNGPRTACFNMVNGVTLEGGWAGFGAPNPNLHDPTLFPTTLSGDLNGNDGPQGTFINAGENTYHVVCADSNIAPGAGLNGLIITAGNANGPELTPTNGGGGVYSLGSPTILNCRMIFNQAGGGGGLFIQIGDPAVLNTTFFGNVARYGAGAIILGDPDNIPSVAPTFHNCRFLGNHATITGGAAASALSSPTFTNCLMSGNIGDLGSGALGNSGQARLINCTVVGNSTPAAAASGGVTTDAPGNPVLVNCILWGNTAAGVANQNAQIRLASGALTITFSCVQGWTGSLGGTGNIGTDPRFNDPDGPDNLIGTVDDDAHLHGGSRAIDAGINTALLSYMTTDLYGNPRIVDDTGTPDTGAGGPPVVDMGVHEFQFSSIAGDVTGDGHTNVNDLLAVIVAWGTCPPVPASCPADLNHDGVVNVDDLLAVIANWLP